MKCVALSVSGTLMLLGMGPGTMFSMCPLSEGLNTCLRSDMVLQFFSMFYIQ